MSDAVRGHFFKNFLTMAAGTTAAQVIPLAALPFLSRLFTPTEFGVLATVVALGALLSVAATARYELAIVLPPSDRDAQAVLLGAMGLAVLVCGTATAVVLVFESELLSIEGLGVVGGWLLLVPVVALLNAGGQIGSSLANRHRDYRRIATASVVQQAVGTSVALAAGTLQAPVNGLVLGRVSGLMAGLACFMRGLAVAIGGARSVGLTLSEVVNVLGRFRQFPLFNMPYSFVGSFSREFIVFMLNAVHATAAAGHYAFVRTLLMAPVGFLSASLSQVYYREAAQHAGSRAFAEFTLLLLLATARILAPAFGILLCWGPDLFAVLFGERWRTAGDYAVIMAIPAMLSLLTSWPERMYEVRNRQNWSFTIQVTCDTLSIGVLWILLSRQVDPRTAITGFAVVQCIYHLIYLGGVFRLVPLAASSYVSLLASLFGSVAVVVLAHQFTSAASGGVAFVIDVIVAGILALLGLLQFRRGIAAIEPR